MRLSPHFTLEEMTLSQTASRRNLDNTPSQSVVDNLVYTANKLESVRALIGSPIIVSSGYRSPEVNAAVGGSPASAHMDGFAADFICPAADDPLTICHVLAESALQFDQLIQEGTWVHISFAPAMRREILTKAGDGYKKGL